MLNSKPNNSNYNQGNYVPKNKDKVLKLNNNGGVYFRSSWEKKIMTWLDLNEKIIKWGAECMKIPYQMTHFDNGDTRVKEHCYYPDFYYELKREDGSISKVVAEVKPYSETIEPKLSSNPTAKQMKNFEYALKMYNKNLSKWTYMIEYCQRKGFEFIIITEKVFLSFYETLF
jgi:hypothetical protein